MVSSPPFTETHTLFSWLILIKSNSSSSPMCCLWSVSKCWWATVWTDSPSLGKSFFYCLIMCVSCWGRTCAHVPCASDISYDLMQTKRGSRAAKITSVFNLVLIIYYIRILEQQTQFLNTCGDVRCFFQSMLAYNFHERGIRYQISLKYVSVCNVAP